MTAPPPRVEERVQVGLEAENNLNDSLPFACEITEINYKQKRRSEGPFLNESMSIADLSVLNAHQPSFVVVGCEEEDYLVLTDYLSGREYSKYVDLNVRLVVNNSASLCYNYFLNDF